MSEKRQVAIPLVGRVVTAQILQNLFKADANAEAHAKQVMDWATGAVADHALFQHILSGDVLVSVDAKGALSFRVTTEDEKASLISAYGAAAVALGSEEEANERWFDQWDSNALKGSDEPPAGVQP